MKSLANTLHQLTAPSKEMPADVFKKLMENAKLEHGSDTDYYFKSKHGNYELLFGYDGETISVDTFGFKHNSGWIELEYSNGQFLAMKRKIESVSPYRDEHEYREKYANEMWQNGHKPSDFY